MAEATRVFWLASKNARAEAGRISMTTAPVHVGAPPRVLADLVANTWVRDLVAVVTFALLTAAAAQISIPLGFTPVPITGQTFAVLLSGGVLGASRGALSQLLYVGLGAIGLPFYADGASGITADGALIATFGYLFGFVIAAWVVGLMAERQQDRSVISAIPAFLAGTAIIYLFGSLFLAWSLGIPFAADLSEPSALAFGIAPFIIGDFIKSVLAGVLLPVGWKFFGSIRDV